MLQFKQKVGEFMQYFNIQQLDLPQDIWLPFSNAKAAVIYSKNQIIYFQDSRADCFYYLKSGQVKTYISSEDGSEKVLTVYEAGNLFGEAAFWGEMPRVSSAIALTQCEVVCIDHVVAREAISNNSELALALMKYLARTVQLLSEHVDDMAFLQTDQRIARYLLSLPRANDGSIQCTQDDIASNVSANRVTVCRILKNLQLRGAIVTGYRSIRILQEDTLKQIIIRE